jgi:hypothetical protein
MKLKEFNLERALAGDPVVTKDGRKILDIHLFTDALEKVAYPIYALVDENERYSKRIESFTKYGAYSFEQNDFDLFMAPKSQKYYVSIFFDESAERIRCGEAELSMRLAESNKKSHYKLLQTIEFEIEEE